MNLEENRLNTFTNWPTSAEVEPIRIAKAGFFYTGQGTEVQCFSCGGKISEWNYGDQVMARHRRLDSNCPFVVNPQISGNVPLILSFQSPSLNERNNSSGSEIPIDESILSNGDYGLTEEDEMYKNDALRLLSFIHWPVSFISRESLVSAGFYYAGEDRVRCAWCGGELAGGWRPGDIPLEEHRRHFPRCSHAAALSAPPPTLQYSLPSTGSYTPSILELSPVVTDSPPAREEQTQQQTSEGAAHNARVLHGQSTWRALGVFGGAEGARHPARASHASRLATFARWPANRPQTPHDLADAGFFYTGTHDQVRCFYCDGGLGKWEAGDLPWTEHARWFPLCGYVLLVKGKDFVDGCRTNGTVQRTVSTDTGLSSRRLNPESIADHPVTESQIEEQMESSAALAALGAGLDAARVRRAIRRRLRTTGAPFNTSEALIDAVLDEQLAEEAWSASPRADNFARNILNDAMQLRMQEPHSMNSLSSTPAPTDQSRQTVSPARSVSLMDSFMSTSERDGSSQPTEPARPTEESTSPAHAASRPHASLEEENRQLKEARMCKVCMDSEVSVVFLPCGHLVSCAVCGASLTACPLCRADVRALVRAYLA